MGTERDTRMRAPGRAADNAAAPIAGKATETERLTPTAGPPSRSGIWPQIAPTTNVDTGNAYPDRGVGCERQPRAANCFLPDGQRQRMVTTYQSRVTAAEGQYGLALASVELDERLKKDPKETDWVTEILLDVIGTLISSSIKKAVHLAMDASPDADHVVEALKPFVGAGKKRVVEHATAAGAAPRSAAVKLIDHLKNEAALIYERLREDALAAVAGDDELILLFESFRAELHSHDVYKREIEDKLVRYEKSKVGKIGVAKNPDAKPIDDIVGGRPTHLDRCAFWVDAPGGPRLALYSRGHRIPDGAEYATDLDRGPAFGTDEEGDKSWQIEAFVPAEFVSVALAMHESTWGRPPEHRAFGVAEFWKQGEST